MEYSKPIGSFKDLVVAAGAGAGSHEGASTDPENGAHPAFEETNADTAAGVGAGGHEGTVHEPHVQPNSPAALESDDNIYTPPIGTYGDLKFAAGGEMAPKDEVKDALKGEEPKYPGAPKGKEKRANIQAEINRIGELQERARRDGNHARALEYEPKLVQLSKELAAVKDDVGDAVPTPKNDSEYRKLGEEYNRLDRKGSARTKADDKRMQELEAAIHRYEGSAEDAEYHGETKTKRVKTAQEKANLLQVLSKMGIKPKIEKVPAGGFEITWTEPSEEERRNLDAY